jgi:hypothetical protein
LFLLLFVLIGSGNDRCFYVAEGRSFDPQAAVRLDRNQTWDRSRQDSLARAEPITSFSHRFRQPLQR